MGAPQFLSPGSSGLHLHWISILGPDARDFLHRLTTADVKRLEVGAGAPACLLNAQGKLLAYFSLWRIEEEHFALEIDAGRDKLWKQRLLEALDFSTFGETFTLSDVTELDTAWLFYRPEIENPWDLSHFSTRALDDEIRICHHGSRDYGVAWISAWGRPARLKRWLDQEMPGAANRKSVSLEEIETWRIRQTRPRVDQELTPDRIPLEVGLVDAVARGKGCYPGQEVTEKILSLGSPPRRLVRIAGSGPAPRPGTALFNSAEPPAEIGQVTSAAAISNGKRFLALALLRKIHAKKGLEIRLQDPPGTALIEAVAPYTDEEEIDGQP